MNQVGRYQILEELGRGACGVVYRALDPAIGRTVAIKSIRFNEFSDANERQLVRARLLREAQSAGILSHPNIVTIYDVSESNDMAHIVMEFVNGTSLKEALQGPELPSREHVLLFLRQIAQALDYAHRKGIVHRDIKPANIMLADGQGMEPLAKIADFGVAKLTSLEGTHQGSFVGTPSYMSPEQLEGQPVNGASDQFSLGIVVYEVLCGERPFTGENLPALHYAICKKEPIPASESNPALNETVNRVLARALAKLPEERFGTCSEFAGALSVALGECPDWVPVTPKKPAELKRVAGVGWYSPETVVSPKALITAPEAEPVALDPVVMPAPIEASPAQPTAIRVGRIDDYENEETATPEIAWSHAGTRVRAEPEAAPSRQMATTMVACAILVLLGILILQFLRKPPTVLTDGHSRVISPSVSTPEDLSATNGPASTAAPPVDLSQQAGGTVATPIGTDSRVDSTIVAVRAPSAAATTAPPVAAPKIRPVPRSVINTPAPPKPLAQTHEVELVTDPPGAHVVVDGSYNLACLSPCSLPLTGGRHTVAAELGGYGTARKIFSAPTDSNVFISMLKNMGMLILTSEPSGTNVVLDGKDLGETPVKIRLAAGRHHLSLSDNGRHHDETILIDPDGVYARSFRW